MLQDFRDAWRALSAAKTVAAAAVVSLTLGIGATTAVFSLLFALVFRPLAVSQPDRLALIAEGGATSVRQSVWIELRDRRIVQDGFAWFWNRMNTAASGEKDFVSGIAATGGLFGSLGITPALGRPLTHEDEAAGAPPAVVIGHALWQRRFGGATDVLGRLMSIEGGQFEIVGVMPATFIGLNVGLPCDVIIPLKAHPRGPHVSVMTRLSAGDTRAQLSSRLQAAQHEIRDATNPYEVSPYRENYLREPLTAIDGAHGASSLRTRYERALRALMAIAAAMLLIGCGSIATLLSARARSRRRELNIRAALGAPRLRLLSMQMAECALIGVTGTCGGIVLAWWISNLIPSLLSTQAYIVSLNLALNRQVLAFSAMAGLVATVLAGAAAAWYVTSANAMAIQSARSHRAPEPRGFANLTVMAQVALSLALVIVAGLFGRTFVALHTRSTGFERDAVLIATVEAPRYDSPETRRPLYERITDAVRAHPDVEAVGISLAMPGGNNAEAPWVELSDGTKLPQGMEGVMAHRVSADWFRALGSTIVVGRAFDLRDTAGSPHVVIVNRAFADRFLAAGDVTGATIIEREAGPDSAGRRLQVIGLVEDAMYVSLKDAPPPTIYTPLAQRPLTVPGPVFVSARARHHRPLALARGVGEALSAVDRTLSFSFRTLADQVGAQYTQERLLAVLSAGFAATGLLLAAVGLYGVLAFTVGRTQFDTAVRIALGATPLAATTASVARTMLSVMAGALVGVVVTWWAARFARSLLYGVDPFDPVSFAAAIALLLAVAALALLGPARRAFRTDLARILKAD